MRQALQTPRKDLSVQIRAGGAKALEAKGFSGEQGDRAAEVSSKGRTEAKQVREREGQEDRQRTIQTATGGNWHISAALMATSPCCAELNAIMPGSPTEGAKRRAACEAQDWYGC